jgi:hypothetical protein
VCGGDRDLDHGLGEADESMVARTQIRGIQMSVAIQKLGGLWHLIVGSCQIRTPFLETHSRQLVVAYARRTYPGAKIFERS